MVFFNSLNQYPQRIIELLFYRQISEPLSLSLGFALHYAIYMATPSLSPYNQYHLIPYPPPQPNLHRLHPPTPPVPPSLKMFFIYHFSIIPTGFLRPTGIGYSAALRPDKSPEKVFRQLFKVYVPSEEPSLQVIG